MLGRDFRRMSAFWDLIFGREAWNLNWNSYYQVNEEASDKVLEVEEKYNEIRRPVYVKRNDVIKSIPDFWLTAVSACA